jgi:hypothetical protein
MKPAYSIKLEEKSPDFLAITNFISLYYITFPDPLHPPLTVESPASAAFALIKFKSNYHLDFMLIKPSFSVRNYTQCKGTQPLHSALTEKYPYGEKYVPRLAKREQTLKL